MSSARCKQTVVGAMPRVASGCLCGLQSCGHAGGSTRWELSPHHLPGCRGWGPGSGAAEDPKAAPCLVTVCQGVRAASWHLSYLPCLFQLLLLRWLLDSPGAEGPPVPTPRASGRELGGCCSMVQACLVCSRVHNSSLTARAAGADMDKTDKPSPSAKKHVRLQER